MDKLPVLPISLKFAEQTKNTELNIQVHDKFGRRYYSTRQYEKAMKHFQVCLAIAKEIGDKNGEGVAYGNLGACYGSLGQHDTAIENQKVGLTIAKEIGDKDGERRAYGNLFVYYSSLSQYDKAIEYQKMGLTIAKEIGDKNGVGAAYGNLGARYHSLGQYDKAIECQKMHLIIAKEIGDKDGEGTAYGNLGVCYHSLGQFDKAIEYQKMGLTIAKEIGDKDGEGRAYSNLGVCCKSLGQNDKAIEYQKMGLTIAKEIGDKYGEGAAYGNLGACYAALGQYDKAIEYQKTNLAMAKEIADKNREGRAYGNLGACYAVHGQYDKTIEYLKLHLTIAEEIGDKNGEGIAYGSLGACYYSLGQYDKAIDYLKMHHTIAQQIGDKNGEGTAYGNLGACYHSLGQYDKAIEYLKMHLTIAKEIGVKNGEGKAYGGLGACYCSLGQYEKAIKYHKMGLTIAREIGDKDGEGRAYGNLGVCYNSLGQYDMSIGHLTMRLSIAKEIGDKNGELKAYGNLGIFYYSLAQYNKAIEYQKMGLTIAKEIGANYGEGRLYGNLGYFYASHGQHGDAESNLRKSLKCHYKLLENVPNWDEYKVSFIEEFVETSKCLNKILLYQKKNGEALIAAENGRSRALVDLMSTSAAKCKTRIEHLHEVRKVVKALESTVLFFALLSRDICTWIIQPNGDVLFHHKTFTDDLHSLINKAVASIEPSKNARCEDRSLSFLYAKDFLIPLKKKTEWVLAHAAKPDNRTVPRVVSSQPSSTAVSAESSKGPDDLKMNSLLKDLYRVLLEPVRQHVVGSQVIIVPDGRLALAPFAAFMDENEHYVAESLRVRHIPSLTIAKIIKERSVEVLSGQARPLIVGEPEVGKVWKDGEVTTAPRLPFAVKEVELISKILHAKPLVGNKATKRRFLRRMESACLIHVAAHGDKDRGEILLARSPEMPKVPKATDLMLLISDLERKRIEAKLVVLSCCHSGCGGVTRGEGVVGIARAFLGAGARAVLVTLWAVDDGATTCFMSRFYEYLKDGESANEALNQAMKDVREYKKFHHPRYWAPFVLLGEDVTPFPKP